MQVVRQIDYSCKLFKDKGLCPSSKPTQMVSTQKIVSSSCLLSRNLNNQQRKPFSVIPEYEQSAYWNHRTWNGLSLSCHLILQEDLIINNIKIVSSSCLLSENLNNQQQKPFTVIPEYEQSAVVDNASILEPQNVKQSVVMLAPHPAGGSHRCQF